MSAAAWDDALLAATLVAVDPGIGGIALRALAGPVRDRFLVALRALMPGAPMRRLPLHIGDDRLLGGLDLPATLQAGHPVIARGVLAEADGGVVLVAMAERVAAATAGRICAVLDRGEVAVERDGVAVRCRTSFRVVALDEGAGPDEMPPGALMDRLAFLVDLSEVSVGEAKLASLRAAEIPRAALLFPNVVMPDEVLEALTGAAVSLGVKSSRALLLAVRAARAASALGGRDAVTEQDVIVAARLVLAPRATMVPAHSAPPPEERPEEKQAPAERADTDNGERQPQGGMTDIVLAACKAAMPAGLLAQLLAGRAERRRGAQSGAGAWLQSQQRGRPVGARAGPLRAGARLNLIETLRAAAPWQTIRRRLSAAAPNIVVMRDDFRITRFRQRTRATTIFLVDASGSAALSRLAEAKGAVELVLADCYARRDQVALIAFRGTSAEVLLPPTSSLVRTRRSLAGLPGGGGTPLAAGIDAALEVAALVRGKGQTPSLVLLSDGRANIARNGTPGRAAAEADALHAARVLRAAAVPAVLVDTSPRPSADARRLAQEMGALYLPLPYADATAVSQAVRRSAA